MPPIVPPIPPRLVTPLATPPPAASLDVEDAISPARFATYLLYARQVRARAWAAYAWNARMSGALLQVFIHAEVALRNGVNRAMTAAFGTTWPYAQAFAITLGKSRSEYVTARARLEKRLGKTPLSTGDFVAGQTMAFWESLLVTRYKGRVWDRQFAAAFPGAVPGETYRDVHDAVERLRLVRNRIAHHEPLLTENVADVYARSLAVIHWASPAKAAWAEGRPAGTPRPRDGRPRPSGRGSRRRPRVRVISGFWTSERVGDSGGRTAPRHPASRARGGEHTPGADQRDSSLRSGRVGAA